MISYEIYQDVPYPSLGGPAPPRSASSPWPAIINLKPARTLFEGNEFSPAGIAALIALWASECELRHAGCRTIRDRDTELPTRLIKVWAGGQDPQLYDTRKEKDTGRYISLSYCWGQAEHHPPKTTKSNLVERKRLISMDSLPPTLADAVWLCMALEVPYLWVDSLCIIQDDPHDWAVEASKMAAVYENAWLTVSADAAADSRGGLFQPIAQRKDCSTRLSLPGGQGRGASNPVRYYGRQPFPQYYHSKKKTAVVHSVDPLEWIGRRRGWHL